MKEILNVWEDKYSTSEYQEVLALQKTNILSKAKRFKETKNSEILGRKDIENLINDKTLKSNLSCKSYVAQTRSKTKLSEQKEQNKPVTPELDQQSKLNDIVEEQIPKHEILKKIIS